jgi:hypothetical protein
VELGLPRVGTSDALDCRRALRMTMAASLMMATGFGVLVGIVVRGSAS